MEQKERKKHERQESASSSRRNGFSNCFSCRSYSSNTSFALLVLLSGQNFPTESFMVARVLVPWLTSWRKTITSPPTGDHEGNKCRTQPPIPRPRPYGSPGLLPDFPA